MDHLYTPWRWEYIVNPKPADCPFCAYLSQGPDHDAENLLLLRTARAFALLNRFPYNNGHLLVMPTAHISDLTAIDPDTQAELMHLTSYCTELLQQVYRPHGFNIGINLGQAAGAGMAAHLHIHIVPRWQGDANFMPVIGQTLTLPETLSQTYQRLRQALLHHPFPGAAQE
ncbi:MAG: HIT domain-containing protein [Caldilineales bacterium]|nr:HIT domain-containing protein [Caldilineales bacterium]